MTLPSLSKLAVCQRGRGVGHPEPLTIGLLFARERTVTAVGALRFEIRTTSSTWATLDGWVMRVGELLSPIVAAMGQELLRGDYIQADETPVDVQMHDGRGKNHQAYLWQYSRPAGPVVFDFRMGREREGPKRFLGNFEGILITVWMSLTSTQIRAETFPNGVPIRSRYLRVQQLLDWYPFKRAKLYEILARGDIKSFVLKERGAIRTLSAV
jgi:hypothetical protein